MQTVFLGNRPFKNATSMSLRLRFSISKHFAATGRLPILLYNMMDRSSISQGRGSRGALYVQSKNGRTNQLCNRISVDRHNPILQCFKSIPSFIINWAAGIITHGYCIVMKKNTHDRQTMPSLHTWRGYHVSGISLSSDTRESRSKHFLQITFLFKTLDQGNYTTRNALLQWHYSVLN